MKNLTVIMCVFLLGSFFVSFANGEQRNLKIAGASTLVPMFQEIGANFGRAHKIGVSIQSGGSEVGVQCAQKGECDLGLSSRALKKDELAGVKTLRLGWDSMAVLVSAKAGVTSLTSKQIADLFNGKIKNWKEIGGANLSVTLFQREKGRALREIFDKHFSVKSNAQEIGTNDEVINRLRFYHPGAIGYASLGLAVRKPIPDVVVVKIDDIEATPENVRSGKYPIKRELVLIRSQKTDGDKLIDEFVKFSLENSKELITKFDFISD